MIFHQKFMGALLGNLTLLHDNNLVWVTDGGESVGNNNASHRAELFLHLFDCFQNFSLVLLVECWRSLVENQNFGLFDESPRQGKSLLLATWKLISWIADNGLKTILKLTYELPCICLFKCADDFSVSCVWLSHQNVLSNCSVEKNWLLADVADLGS